VDDAGLRVCLERSVELAATRLRFRDWPGRSGPIVHVPDSFVPSQLAALIADAFAPRHRVLSLEPRPGVSYQTDAEDLAGFLGMFGFVEPVLLAEGRGCITAVLVASWHPSLVGRLVLIAPDTQAPCGLTGLAARGLHECPPDWSTLVRSVTAPILELNALTLEPVEAFLGKTSG
jgi:pimeloyl-ACP methyl ester carboxylesterase